MKSIAFLLVLLSVLSPESASAASFPCEKATSRTETLICKERELSTLDEHLAQYYAGAAAALGDVGTCLRDNQRAWLRTVRNACADAGCLKQVYFDRLAELHPLQPGVTAIRAFELPKVPGLVWVVAPEKDTIAAPRRANLRELTVTGRLLDDVAQGDGFVVQAQDGRKHVLVPLMFLGGANQERLEFLAKQPGRVEVRGFAETDSSGIPHFASSRCSFVYRVP